MKKRTESTAPLGPAHMSKGPLSAGEAAFLEGGPKGPTKKSTSVKFRLPTEGDEGVQFRLTGFEEVKSPSKSKFSAGRQPSSWTPSQGIKKFDFNDLPSLATLTDQIFSDTVPMSKGFGSLLEPEVKGLTKGSKSPKGESFMGGTSEQLRNDLLKVSAKIKGDLDANIGFGFTNVSKRSPGRRSVDSGLVRNEAETHSKMVDKSITSLQSKIQEQRRKFQEYQTGNLKFPPSPTAASIKLTNRQGLRTSVPKSENFLVRKKAQENAKLNEIARIFRQSLEASAKDPNEVIRLPGREKSPAKNHLQVTKGSVVTKMSGVGKPFLGRPKSLVINGPPSQKGSIGPDNAGLMDLRQLLSRKHAQPMESAEKPSKLMDPLEFTKKKIQELDEPFEVRRRSERKAPSVEFAEYLEAMNNEGLSEPLGDTPPSGNNRTGKNLRSESTLPSELVQQRLLAPSVKTAEDAGAMAKGLGTLMTHVAARRPPGDMSPSLNNNPKVTAADLAKSLGLKFDMNSILDSKSPKDQAAQLLKLTQEMGGVVSLAMGHGEIFEPNTLLDSPLKKGKKPSANGDEIPKVSGNSRKRPTTKVGKTVEIQTEEPNPSPPVNVRALNQPIKFLLPEIKFTKDMTERDQEMLHELRALKTKWDSS